MKTVGRYELERTIGRGGAATVYLARQLDLDRSVALKELNGLGTIDPSAARRFLREARLAGSLNHPSIVTVHDYFAAGGVPYIAMEYLARGSLRTYANRLGLEQIGSVLESVLSGLAYAERQGIVHRDIKPENILVTDEGGVKIADFGIAKATNAIERSTMLTVVGTTVGTPNYIAPEQAMAHEVGPWTDFYSLGIVTFELLVGRTPFAETEDPMAIVLRHVNEPVPRVVDVAPGVPGWISDWVGWLTAKRPADRPQTAAQAWEALEEALIGAFGPRWRRYSMLLPPGEQTPPTAVDPRLAVTTPPRRAPATPSTGVAAPPPLPPSRPPRPRPRRRPARMLKIVAAAAMLAVAGLAFAGQQSGRNAPAPAQAPAPALTPAPAAARTKATTPALTKAPTPVKTDPPGAARAKAPARARTTAPPSRTKAPPAKTTAPAPARTTAPAPAQTTARAPAPTTAPAPATTQRAVTTRPPATTTSPPPAPRPTPAPAPTPAPDQGGPCAGDSTSDDPSDDSCGGA